MLHRQICRFINTCAALLAVTGILLFSFAAPGSHAPNLHAATSVEDRLASGGHHSHSLNHTHDDHSHDDRDGFADSGSPVSDHHHADHTHEKAGLVTVAGTLLRTTVPGTYLVIATTLAGSRPDGIHRPPRQIALI